jgi:hypothetical protein
MGQKIKAVLQRWRTSRAALVMASQRSSTTAPTPGLSRSPNGVRVRKPTSRSYRGSRRDRCSSRSPTRPTTPRPSSTKSAAASPPSPVQANAAQLFRLKGIGVHFSTTLAGEVYYRTFKNRRGVGQTIGLAPSPFQSGDMARDQGIAKAGNGRARKAMIELAWMWRRHQPDSALSKWFRERVGDKKGRVKRIAIVAMARKLSVALWRYLETGLVPEGAVLKRA